MLTVGVAALVLRGLAPPAKPPGGSFLSGPGAQARAIPMRRARVGIGPARTVPSLGVRAVRGTAIGELRCTAGAQRSTAVDIELFARGHAVRVSAGAGIAPPRPRDGAYVKGGRCRLRPNAQIVLPAGDPVLPPHASDEFAAGM